MIKIIKYIKKNILVFISYLLTIGIATIGFIINSNIQNKIEKLEIESRAINFQPVLEFKSLPTLKNIILERDTTWYLPKYDFESGKINEDSIVNVYFNYSTDLKFNIINNSNIRTDILLYFIFDTISTVPINYNKRDIFNESKKNIDIIETPLQLGPFDSTEIIIDKYKIQRIDNNIFYIHFVIIYVNQFNDVYESYFVIKGKISELEIMYKNESLFDKYKYVRISEILVSDGLLKLEPLKPYIQHIGNFTDSEYGKKFYDIIDSYINEKEKSKKIFNNF